MAKLCSCQERVMEDAIGVFSRGNDDINQGLAHSLSLLKNELGKECQCSATKTEPKTPEQIMKDTAKLFRQTEYTPAKYRSGDIVCAWFKTTDWESDSPIKKPRHIEIVGVYGDCYNYAIGWKMEWHYTVIDEDKVKSLVSESDIIELITRKI